jgi:hypothetical protein
MDKQEHIISFAKNSIEEVRVSISEYKGRRYLSLWVWFKDDDDNWQPSKKGLVLSLDLLSDLKKAVDTALAKIEFEEEAKTQKQAGGSETKAEGRIGR